MMLMNDASTLALPSSLDDVLSLTAKDRAAVDELITHRLRSDIALVNQISHYIIGSGGKRLRPLLHLLAARAAGYEGDHHIQMAAIIEFIHTATLLHDDVVDESSRRRGQEAAHRIWGNAASVLVGDFLYSRSFQLMVELETPEVMRILANTTNTIAEGEVLQLMQMGNAELDLADYFQVISDKTACLFAASARLGGVLARRGESVNDALAEFGLLLGQSFQITDDVLDYRADNGDPGKSLGDDLAEGKVTLPLIIVMQRTDEATRHEIVEMIQGGGSPEYARVRSLMDEVGALDAAMEQARELSVKAKAGLTLLDDSPARRALEVISDYAVDRSL
jgi:octaprenyl-diphosphate synthase